ncbi:MAG: protein kinase [Myxococcales bacterium]|nr:protein kinase [Myxococcales bacterium]
MPSDGEASQSTTDASEPSVEHELARINVRRLRIFLPVMVIVHLAHSVALRTPNAALPPAEQQWQRGLWLVNTSTLPVAFALALVVWRGGSRRLLEPRAVDFHVGDLVLGIYLVFAAATTVVDQWLSSSAHAYVMGALATAFILRTSPKGAAIGYVIGTAIVLVGARFTQRSAAGLSSVYLGVLTVSAIAYALARTTVLATRREFEDRNTIEKHKALLDRQATELRTLNAQLEQRVDEQVREIVARASEVQALNAQLAERVQERSRELSRALARLAKESDERELPEGSVLGGRVVILSLLGRGGMGAVYLGLDRVSGQRVAVKVMQAASAQELEELQRFLREAEATSRVTHPAIVKSLAVDVSDDGRFYQILELIDGVTLASVIDRRGPMLWTIAVRLIALVADALAAAHAANIVHRDIKPENIMLTRAEPGVKVLDFGIARVHNVAESQDTIATNQTRSGVLLGTPRYMAPEQIVDPAQVNNRADVYALALVLYVCVAGRTPFDATTVGDVFAAHAMAEPARLDVHVKSVPTALTELVQRCLAKSASDRPSAAELRDALEVIASASGTAADSNTWAELIDATRAATVTPESTVTLVGQVV